MIKSHPNPKLADQILSACPYLADLRDALKANVEAVRARNNHYARNTDANTALLPTHRS